MAHKEEPKGSTSFRRYRRCPKTGIVLDAHDYGYKAWPMKFKKRGK